jgi:tetratricopeptide (TPR) repeat protein
MSLKPDTPHGMAPGPDGDDEELLEIDLEPDGPPPLPIGRGSDLGPDLVIEPEDTQPDRVPLAPAIPDPVEVRPPIVEAAESDPRADLALYELEAAAADGGRRAALLLEAARLREADAPDDPGALEASRAAFLADPSMPLALWPLRRLLAGARLWSELVDVYDRAARARPAADLAGRADLLVERGRLLEDRLNRAPEAIACYQEALAAVPDHLGALLSLLLAGAQRRQTRLVAAALGGLARRADTPARRAALAIEEARARRLSGGVEPALAVLETELGRADPEAPLGSLLVELDALTGEALPADIRARALAELARWISPADPPLAVALLRERARVLLSQAARDPALAALTEAARLDPAHPLVAAQRFELALGLDRLETADQIARAFVAAAATDDEAVDFALGYAEARIRAGRADAAREVLRTPRIRARRSARVDLRALELAIAVRQRDPAALADAFAAEAAPELGGDELAQGSALVAAGALRGSRLGELAAAEDFYRRAFAIGPGSPGARGALRLLIELLLAGGRTAEAAAALEAFVAAPTGGGAGPEKDVRGVGDGRAAFEAWAREMLVSLYADELGLPGRALAHQRRLVALTPGDVARRVRLADLDLASGAGAGLSPDERAENLMALGASAGVAAVAVALRVAAGRTLAAAESPAARARGVALLRELAAVDPTGLASSALERASPTAAARAEVVAAELTVDTEVAPERVRALRFRLANHYAADGRYAESLATLTPLRSEGDPLARAWSYELARRSGEAILEVAVLSEETQSLDGVLGDEAGVLLASGEALARAGDPQGAAASLRQALAVAPTGETAADASLALFRLAAVDATAGARALPDALGALATALTDDPALAAVAAREASLARAATGQLAPVDLDAQAPPEAPAKERAEATLLRFMAGARQGDARVVAEALAEIASDLTLPPDGAPPAEAVALLGRAAARARLAGPATADAVAVAVWEATRRPELAPALSDLRATGGGPWPAGRPDTRRARARRTGGATGIALDLELALDAERRGALGAALAAYGSVVAIDPARLEAWTGIRRVARAGGDLLGEARALVRLGALVSNPDRAAELFVEAGAAYERSGRTDDAIAALARAVELRPDDAIAYGRVHALLRADFAAPGRADAFDGLLSYRLASSTLAPGHRIALLFERAEHRLSQLGNRAAAFGDLEQIIRIDPDHVPAIHKLAYGAILDEDVHGASHWLERYLAVIGSDEPERAASARLDLAVCYEARGDPQRAIETLRWAAELSPADPRPLERLSETSLRRGDVRDAVEALRGAASRLSEPRARAALELRVGEILRDVGRDPAGAAAAFRHAADLDPLGAGVGKLVALADAAGDAPAALETVEREIGDLRRALGGNPLDARRLERLAEYLHIFRARGAGGAVAEAEAAVESVRQLVESRLPPPTRAPAQIAPKGGPSFIDELAEPAAGGLVSEVWPHLVEVATTIFPAPGGRGRRSAISAEQAPRVAWIAATAAAIGLPRLPLYLTHEPGARAAVAVEDPEPGLVLAAGRLADPETRFHVGRALGLLAQRATVLERASADELAPLYACAAILAGAAPPDELTRPSDGLLRDVTRALGRKDRKALTLQASRFAFERFDLDGWRQGALRAADRFGLLVAGDPALAAIALAGGASAVPSDEAALDLIRFALGDRYPALRRASRETSE